MQAKSVVKKIAEFIYGIVLLYAITACDQGVNKNFISDAQSATAAKETPKTLEVKLPQHFYALKDSDEYGYEPEISDNQKDAGQVTSPLLMYRFLGEKKGQYQLLQSKGTMRIVFDCEKPCEFLRVRAFVDGYEVSKDRMRRVEGSILYYAFEDAMEGKLDQHFIMKKGKKLTLWYED